MGFRSTMTTGDWALDIPESFLEKYPYIRARKLKDKETYTLPLTLNQEIKFYSAFKDYELFQDIQKLIVEQNFTKEIDLVLLHECGGITKVIISKTDIKGKEPLTWKEVEYVEHSYCYGCSD